MRGRGGALAGYKETRRRRGPECAGPEVARAAAQDSVVRQAGWMLGGATEAPLTRLLLRAGARSGLPDPSRGCEPSAAPDFL